MSQQLEEIKLRNLNFSALESHVGLVTPELAAELLTRNFDNNRNLSTPTVNRYAEAMKNGQWMLSAAINFSSNGVLIDGQHRLQAVIRTGTPQPFVIMTGLPFQSANVLDQGRNRTTVNICQINGLSFQNIDVSVLRMAILAASDFKRGADNLYTPMECMILLDYFKEPIRFTKQHSRTEGAAKVAPVLAPVLMAYFDENHQRLDDFLYCWHKSETRVGTQDNAATKFRSMYNKEHLGSTGREARTSLFKKTQSVLRYFLKGDTAKYFKEINEVLWGKKVFARENLRKIIEQSQEKQKYIA